MYRTELDPDVNRWEILDPEGDHICYVNTEEEAYSLLSHLNRSGPLGF
jgi:hypothetical protein